MRAVFIVVPLMALLFGSIVYCVLAILGAAILIGEWIVYGRYSPVRLRVVKPSLGRAA